MQTFIDRARRGDREALGHCLKSCQAYLLSVANLLRPSSLPPHLGASDVVQEAYLRCCDVESFRRFRGETEEELRAYLRAAVLHALTDQYRRARAAKRNRGRDISLNHAEGDAAGREIASSATSPSGQAMRREHWEILLDAIEGLEASDEREIMTWRYVAEQSFDTIAALLGKSKGYVVQRHARCIARLRSRIAKAEGLSDVE